MKAIETFKQKQVFSFEVFPPKRTAEIGTIYNTLDGLKGLHPDFISVTYGAGGSSNFQTTMSIASSIKKDYGIESVAHLPCISLSKADVDQFLDACRQNQIDNILALRGDRNPDLAPSEDFTHASDLIAYVKEHSDFHIVGACYPEGHQESNSIVEDIRHLKEKVDAGADHLITQLFFDNKHFYDFKERCELADIHVPIEAGIMPVINKKQIERMATLCGTHLPDKFLKMMERYENDPIAMRDAGIAYAINQIVDLIAQGVDGIHLYTMNNPYVAHKIHDAVHNLLKSSQN